MDSNEGWVLATWFGIAFTVIGLFYLFGWISPRAWQLHCLICFLIAAVIWGSVAIMLTIQEAAATFEKTTTKSANKVTAAFYNANKLKVDKRHSEAVPPLSSDVDELDLLKSKTEES